MAALSALADTALAACDLPIQGDGFVEAIVDARTLRLDDGREVRLAGIELLQGTPDQTIIGRLKDLSAERAVTLRGADDAPDRYGRQQAFVVVEDANTSLQSELVRQGLAVAGLASTQTSCAVELAEAETEARTARRGLWSVHGVVKSATNEADILQSIGRFAVIEGTVVSARTSNGTLYLNFSRHWIQGFAVTISRRMMPSFTAAGLTAASLENRQIRVRGWVERRGGPRIEAISPGQIELIADPAAGVTAKRDER